MLSISPDGYIRLTLSLLASIELVHLVSGLDEDMPESSGESAAPTAITGYTEWVSTTSPAISMGWDWIMEVVDGIVRPARLGEPRSNCMLVDEGNSDLGPAQSNAALAEFVDTLPWQSETGNQIASRYHR